MLWLDVGLVWSNWLAYNDLLWWCDLSRALMFVFYDLWFQFEDGDHILTFELVIMQKVPSELSLEDDIKALFLKFLSISKNETKLSSKDEVACWFLFSRFVAYTGNFSDKRLFSVSLMEQVMKWVDFASYFLANSGSSLSKLEGLNEDLVKKSALLGDGFKTSEADVDVYSSLLSFVMCVHTHASDILLALSISFNTVKLLTSQFWLYSVSCISAFT